MSPGSESGPRENWRGPGLLGTDAARDRPATRAPRRRTEPGVLRGQALEGIKPRRAPTRRSSFRPERRSSRERIFRGEQSFEAGVPAANGRARRARERRSRSTRFTARTTDRLSGREEPPSRPMRPASPRGRVEAKGRRGGESGRETLGHVAPGSGRTRTRTEAKAQRKRARLLGRGKALKGDSRDASGMEQGREASGRRDGRVPQGARFRGVQPEPSRGARTLRTAPAGARQALVRRVKSRLHVTTGGTRRRRVRGSKKPGRRIPHSRNAPVASADGAEKESGRRRRGAL